MGNNGNIVIFMQHRRAGHAIVMMRIGAEFRSVQHHETLPKQEQSGESEARIEAMHELMLARDVGPVEAC